jgi:hypothetical protein
MPTFHTNRARRSMGAERTHFGLDQLVTIGQRINAQDFGHPFILNPDGTVTDAPQGIYAPETVELAEFGESELHIEGPWESVTHRMSGQHAYTGPIMHPSEFVGAGMARLLLSDEPQALALAEVTDPDDVDGDPVGWTIVRYTGTGAGGWPLKPSAIHPR